MKKTISSLLMIFVIITSVYSQNGYKDFKWGMTSEQVSELVLTFQESSEDDSKPIFQKSTEYDSSPSDSGSSLSFVMSYLYGSELQGSIPHPGKYAIDFVGYNNGRSSAWIDDGGLEFFFSKNKLVGVVTYFHNANIISELEKKYGKGISLKFYINNTFVDEGRVWLDKKRYIVWSKSDLSSTMGVEFVTYLDAEWSKELCRKCIQNYKKEIQLEKSRIKSRLD